MDILRRQVGAIPSKADVQKRGRENTNHFSDGIAPLRGRTQKNGAEHGKKQQKRFLGFTPPKKKTPSAVFHLGACHFLGDFSAAKFLRQNPEGGPKKPPDRSPPGTEIENNSSRGGKKKNKTTVLHPPPPQGDGRFAVEAPSGKKRAPMPQGSGVLKNCGRAKTGSARPAGGPAQLRASSDGIFRRKAVGLAEGRGRPHRMGGRKW